MEMRTWLHQAVLFVHLVTFAIAMATVLRADLGLLRARRFDAARLAAAARVLGVALWVLWLSGAALLAFDQGPDPTAWLHGAKPTAKLLVVTALTANGLALHAVVFPHLRRRDPRAPRAAGSATLPAVLGAVSTTSWLFASFIGSSRIVAPSMSLKDFLGLYAVALGVAIVVAVVFVRRHVQRLLQAA